MTIGCQIDCAGCERYRMAHGQITARTCDAGRDTARARNVIGDGRIRRTHVTQYSVVGQSHSATGAQGAGGAAVAHLQSAAADGRGAGVGVVGREHAGASAALAE